MRYAVNLCALSLLAMSLAACSKQPESAGADVIPATNKQAVTDGPSQQRGGAAAALNALPEVSKAMQAGQYQSAVNTLTQMKLMTPQMTETERLQYQQAVRDAATALLNVREKDPAARAAYEKLSRSATGR